MNDALTNEEVFVLLETDAKAYIAWLNSVSSHRCWDFLEFAFRQHELYLSDTAKQMGLSTKRTEQRN